MATQIFFPFLFSVLSFYLGSEFCEMSNLCQNKHVFKSNPDVLPLASLTKANGF
jgi:hypothetical protein